MQDDLVRQAGPLFQLTAEGWSFFHNSCRQFVLLHTARNPLTRQSDSQADAHYYKRLAIYYQKVGRASKQKPRRAEGPGAKQACNASYHFYRAGKVKKFLRLITPDCLGQQLLDFQPAAEIRRDIELGLHLARETSDVGAAGPVSVCASRIYPAPRPLQPGRPGGRISTARPPGPGPAAAAQRQHAAGAGSGGLARRRPVSACPLAKAHARPPRHLRAAGLVQLAPYQDLAEAALLFRLAEPLAVRPDGLVIDGTEFYAQVQGTLRAWVAAAWRCYPLSDLLARLRHIRIVGGAPSSR
ncbi:hypothetical protein [Hymenobacter cheonanensis]|uniref:hypothetical protein n=1 Tax=Hymenobacter sp. CA2-7 TaxID=3063993 RepID=UPI0027123E18|nr:hypothetical protein [Hymenobacter sp. CA2-7]MDO7886919.1 hypothetical protein [Hymenobacter sp. CA2-7]